MDKETRQYINRLAQIVIDEYNISIPIVNIDEVVKSMNGVIEESEEHNELYDGTISKIESDSFAIVVSQNQSSQRRNFTIAHELGHLFLHMGFRTDADVWSKQTGVYRRFGTSDQEYQANEFAAALLMPDDVYREVVDRYTTKDNYVEVSKVANYFHVSVAAATNRGRFLGVLDE